jgi:tetratricopeptide (TPR) repeat protein
MGGPAEISYKVTLVLPAAVKVHLPVPVAVSRDYGAYHSRYAATGTTTTVERSLTMKLRQVPGERRQDVIAFLRVLTSDTQQEVALDASAMTAAAAAPETRVKELNQSGYDALRAGELDRAVSLLKRVVELDPKDRTAWNNLGRAYMGLRNIDAAIKAYRTQIEVNPYDEYAYNNLGLAFAASGRPAEAETAYAKQLEVNPLDRFAHANLGRLYIRQEQYDKAAAAFEKAIALTPDNSALLVQLGKAYLSLHKNEQATSSFARAVELAPAPGTWNDVAYELSLRGVDLERAQRYAESALASAAAASRNLDVEHTDARSLGVVESLGAYWDTLGWVYFAKGDLDKAQHYVEAAWRLTQHAEVGDHLGQIHEKTGRRDAALKAYAQAASALQPDPAVRAHLVRLAGGAARADALVAEHRGDLSGNRRIELPGKGPAGKKAEFLVLFAAPGHVEVVKFIEGDEEIRALVPALRKVPASGMFPDDTPAKLLRRGIAACGPAGACALTLLLPEDAKPVK